MRRVLPAASIVDQETIDALVAAAHLRPARAARMLTWNQALCRSGSSWGETGLEAASHVGHKFLAWRFIEAGAAPDIFAMCAVGARDRAISRYDRKRPDICGVHGLPLLHFAIVSRAATTVEVLLDAGVEVNPRRASLPPLHSAVATGRCDLVRLLIEAGADRSARDAYGATALDWSIELGGKSSSSVRQLLL